MKSARLGQNFLVNAGVADRIISLIPPGEDPVLEIGPGSGVLTRRILERFPQRSLTLVEKDPRLAVELETRLGERVYLIQRDVLTCRADELIPEGKAILVGNIPYLISTPLLEWIVFHQEAWKSGILMTQEEFARRLMEGTGPLPATIRAFFSIHSIMRVRPGSFSPPPKVFSRVFTLTPRNPGIHPRRYHAFLEQCFRQRRRSLRNNLRGHFPEKILDAALEKQQIPPNIRAEAVGDDCLRALHACLTEE